MFGIQGRHPGGMALSVQRQLRRGGRFFTFRLAVYSDVVRTAGVAEKIVLNG